VLASLSFAWKIAGAKAPYTVKRERTWSTKKPWTEKSQDDVQWCCS